MNQLNRNSKKRFGIFLDFQPDGGGTFQYALTLIESLSLLNQTQFEIVAAYTDKNWTQYLPKHFIQVFLKKTPRMNLLWRIWIKLRLPVVLWRIFLSSWNPNTKLLKDAQAEFWFFPCQDHMSFHFPVPAVVSVHDLMHIYERRFVELEQPFSFREHMYKNIAQFSLGVLVDSELGKKQFLENYKYHESRVHVLPYVPPAYIRHADAVEEVPELIGKDYFFYPAQYWSHKNHIRLLESFFQFQKKYPDTHLVFCGSEKNSFHEIIKTIEKLNLQAKVILLGYASNEKMVWLYKHSRGLVFPSFLGPTNIPPLEALYLGIPCACADVYAAQDYTFGKHVYFNPESVEEMTQALEKIWAKRTPLPNADVLPLISIEKMHERLDKIIHKMGY